MKVTIEQFAEQWQECHGDMDVSAEVPFYFDCYEQLQELSVYGSEEYPINNSIFWLLRYVEDMGGLKLGKWNMGHYRLAENRLDIFFDNCSFAAGNHYKGFALLKKFIKLTPKSGVKQYVSEAILNLEFDKLLRTIKWYLWMHPAFLDCMMGDLKDEMFHERIFKEQDYKWVRSFSDTDDALFWKAKDGKTLIQRLVDCFDGKEYMEVRNNLLAMHPHTVNAYRVLEVHDHNTVTFEYCKRKIKGTITLPQPLPENYEDLYLVGDMVEWDKWYLPEPYAWIPRKDMVDFEPDELLKEMEERYDNESIDEWWETVSGKRFDVHKDLFAL